MVMKRKLKQEELCSGFATDPVAEDTEQRCVRDTWERLHAAALAFHAACQAADVDGPTVMSMLSPAVADRRLIADALLIDCNDIQTPEDQARHEL